MDSINNYIIEPYSKSMSNQWDDFVRQSRNGTFLHLRGYMDYHSDRFRDCSWMVRRGGKLRAILPANITPDRVLHSHQGLTYGGWVLPIGHLDGADLLEIFQAAVEKWSGDGIISLDYKPVPYIYSGRPSEEDRYALYRLGAEMTGCGISSVVDQVAGISLNQMQRRHLRDSVGHKWTITEEENVESFMRLLSDCLYERHGVSPVHSAEELQLLRDRFPQNIRIFLLRLEGKEAPDAGVCLYDTGIVAHAQYIATTSRGRDMNLLTPLFFRLISDTFAARRYFDFGISTEDNGRILNTGLLRQKFSYGATAVIYPRYTLRLHSQRD